MFHFWAIVEGVAYANLSPILTIFDIFEIYPVNLKLKKVCPLTYQGAKINKPSFLPVSLCDILYICR